MLMKIRPSILVMPLLAIILFAAGCSSNKATAVTSVDDFQGHNPSLVMPTDSILELAAADDFAAWEWSRNDQQLGGQPLPRDTSYRIVETRQWDLLGTSNGRPRDHSFMRIRTYTRESR